VAGWIKRDATNRFDYMASKLDTGNDRREWLFGIDNDAGKENDLVFSVSKDGTSAGYTILNSGKEVTDSDWHHLVATYKFVTFALVLSITIETFADICEFSWSSVALTLKL